MYYKSGGNCYFAVPEYTCNNDGDIASYTSIPISSCLDLCEANTDCVSVQWITSGPYCYLKDTACTPTSTDGAATIYRKGKKGLENGFIMI